MLEPTYYKNIPGAILTRPLVLLLYPRKCCRVEVLFRIECVWRNIRVVNMKSRPQWHAPSFYSLVPIAFDGDSMNRDPK